MCELEIDLAAVDYLDSSALGMLLMLREKAQAADKTVVAVQLPRGGAPGAGHRQLRQAVQPEMT